MNRLTTGLDSSRNETLGKAKVRDVGGNGVAVVVWVDPYNERVTGDFSMDTGGLGDALSLCPSTIGFVLLPT